jgi:L-lactate dehydrogenase complex protein LldE
MVKHFHELFPDEAGWRRRAEKVAAKTHEFGGFLTNVLKIDDVGASFKGKITWHDACHGLRELGLRDEPRRLLKKVHRAEFIELSNADSCCGFGGTFSVKFPEISVAILDNKINSINAAGVRAVVSGDASCLMQIGGRLTRLGSSVKAMHLAEVLASQE